MKKPLGEPETRVARFARLSREKWQLEQEIADKKVRVSQISTELQTLQRELDELEAKATQPRRRKAAHESEAPAPDIPFPPLEAEDVPLSTDGTTTKARVLEVLRRERRPMSPAAVAAAVGGISEKQALFTLQSIQQREKGLLEKPGRGLWQIAESDGRPLNS